MNLAQRQAVARALQDVLRARRPDLDWEITYRGKPIDPHPLATRVSNLDSRMRESLPRPDDRATEGGE